ncbi:c-type cytochrome biogenesis protein CcmI [Palleronia sp. LCG004]|uniref:c-type cytochrome biogenesis protein CcmI n=1 Tax=Palleronia sp. LCG004 TaxID=3079304 RepID=UPI00294324DA|nr:c-type cytochrome biogenesis protein CcmI [Palleronia sp. LCG004]WOI55250.1 c-type cytochrome biogenesis protein CcmI [Palleronia sp. LCG004]
MFWLIAAMLTGLVLAPVAAALLRGAPDARPSPDIAVYRDQLSEIDRDLARGTLDPDEAQRTRLEVQRRLLDADRAGVSTHGRASKPVRLAMAGLVAIGIIGGGFGLYAVLGAPGYPDLPIQARFAQSEEIAASRPDQATAEAEAAEILPPPSEPEGEFGTLMTRLREVLAERPDDIEGLRLLARNEAGLGDFRAARIAQAHLVEVRGDEATPEDLAALGEFMVLATGGFVSPEAEQVIDRVLTENPGNGRAAYYKGLALAQVGRPDRAFGIWRDLLERSPPDAPWVAPVQGQIVEAAERAGIRYDPPETPAPRGPSAVDIEAAADMSEEDRAAMISNMVSSLSERLATQGGPSTDWARLIVAYSALDRTDRARAILEEARDVFGESPADLSTIDDAAARAGLR